MNKGLYPKHFNQYATGEIRFGVSSPGTDWVKADGSSSTQYSSLQKLFNGNPLTWATTAATNVVGTIKAIAYGNNKWAAVGDNTNGVVGISTDGATWTTVYTGIPGAFSSVFYANNMFLAVGAGGFTALSTDGTTWAPGSGSFSQTPYSSLTYGNNTWAIGMTNTALITAANTIVPAGTYWNYMSLGQTYPTTGSALAFTSSGVAVVGLPAGIIKYNTMMGGGATWTTATSNFGSSNVSAIAYNGSTFLVAVGAGGAIRRSTDAITWDTATSNTTNLMYNVVYGNTWIAVGDLGTIRTSTDGLTWATQTSNFGASAITALAYGASIWVAVGVGGTIRRSTDSGVTWATQTSNFGTSNINGITYGNGRFAAVGAGGALRTSTDGITWATQTSNTTAILKGVAYNSTTGFVAVGYSSVIRLSTDGVTWTSAWPKVIGTNFSNVMYNTYNESFYAYDAANYLHYSGKTVSWNPAVSCPPNTGGSNVTAIVNGGSLWAVAESGGAIYTASQTVATAGYFWTSVTSLPATLTSTVGKCLWAGNGIMFAGSSSGTISISSSLGAYWFSATSNLGTSAVNAGSYGNGVFVAVGAGGAIRRSTDGITWDTATSNTTSIMYNVVYGNTWIAVGASGTIRTSADGLTWTTQTSNFGTSTVNAIAYGASIWVAGGVGGAIRRSTDSGVTWATQTSNFGTSTINSITYGNGAFIAVGDGSTTRRSTDGITWATVTSGVGVGINLSHVAYGNIFVAGGPGGSQLSTDGITWSLVSGIGHLPNLMYYGNNWYASYSVGAALYVSTNAFPQSWTTQPLYNGTQINALTYGNGVWVAAVSASQSLLTSTNGSLWRQTSRQGGVTTTTATVSTATNVAYGNNIFVATYANGMIEMSTDGFSWVSSAIRTNSTGLTAAAYGNNMWVVGGSSNVTSYSLNTLPYINLNNNIWGWIKK